MAPQKFAYFVVGLAPIFVVFFYAQAGLFEHRAVGHRRHWGRRVGSRLGCGRGCRCWCSLRASAVPHPGAQWHQAGAGGNARNWWKSRKTELHNRCPCGDKEEVAQVLRGGWRRACQVPCQCHVVRPAWVALARLSDGRRTTGVMVQRTGVLASRRGSALAHSAACCAGSAAGMCSMLLGNCRGIAALKWQAWQVVHWLALASVPSAAAAPMWQGGLESFCAAILASKVLAMPREWA